jgi:hypothetical protein
MASLYPYTFNSTTRIRDDNSDRTQQNIMSTRHNDYMMSSYFSDKRSDDHVNFATAQPGIMFNGSVGSSNGITANTVDIDSMLTIKNENSRTLEKLSLQQRPFLTVPYLGRGSADTALESQMMQGDVVTNKKSISTITEQSFMNNHIHPLLDNVKETSLDGWIRGGVATREMMNKDKHLPNNNSF